MQLYYVCVNDHYTAIRSSLSSAVEYIERNYGKGTGIVYSTVARHMSANGAYFHQWKPKEKTAFVEFFKLEIRKVENVEI